VDGIYADLLQPVPDYDSHPEKWVPVDELWRVIGELDDEERRAAQ